MGYVLVFQSTLLMRGATTLLDIMRAYNEFQSTLLMRGATCKAAFAIRGGDDISIHAPHARSDTAMRWKRRRRQYFNPRSSCEERLDTDKMSKSRTDFNPRSSCEERHPVGCLHPLNPIISIHAPHARSDRRHFPGRLYHKDFNPRSSCEERHEVVCTLCGKTFHFNPRSSCEERPQD